MAKRGGDTSAKARAAGKTVGRPRKPKVEQRAGKGIASEVLAMDGPPDHQRACSCHLCKAAKNCTCRRNETGIVLCDDCKLRAEHKICRCEVCGWWDGLTATDKRLRFEVRRYLTDRRDGKPAQGVFVGDTRESARELDFGDLPELIATGQSQPDRRPN